MSRKCSLSIVLFIYVVFFSLGQLSAQEEDGKIIIISERVGKEIDQEEREQFKLFEGIKAFQYAIKPPYGKYISKITYIDETTNELKIDRTQQNVITDTSKSSDNKEKDFYISPYLAQSTLVGTIGIEFQYKHLGFDVGDLSVGVRGININHCLTVGIRYYFNSNHNSWFIGLGGGITLDQPKPNENLCPGTDPAEDVCGTGYIIDKYIGIIFGYRWKLWKDLNLNLGIGPNKLIWKKIKEGDKGDYLPMIEMAIGYSF